MAVNKKRPININPLSVQLPVGACVSIMHRLSGLLIFLFIPLLLWMLERSLASPEGLNQVKDCLHSPVCSALIWIFLGGLAFHLLAGIRHLLMDIDVGGSLKAARCSAKAVLVGVTLLIVGAAYWIWR